MTPSVRVSTPSRTQHLQGGALQEIVNKLVALAEEGEQLRAQREQLASTLRLARQELANHRKNPFKPKPLLPEPAKPGAKASKKAKADYETKKKQHDVAVRNIKRDNETAKKAYDSKTREIENKIQDADKQLRDFDTVKFPQFMGRLEQAKAEFETAKRKEAMRIEQERQAQNAQQRLAEMTEKLQEQIKTTAEARGEFVKAPLAQAPAVKMRQDLPSGAGEPLACVPAKLSLGDALKNYQVKDDGAVDWSPKALGLIPLPFADSVRLTETEGKLLDNLSRDRGLLGLAKFKEIHDQAFAESTARYPDPKSFPSQAGTSEDDRRQWANNDGHRDAFRHAYWSALLTKTFGEKWTKQFTTAHEAMPGNLADREAMDLFNNEVGRQIAAANPNVSEKQLGDLIERAVKDGKMIVIGSSGNLAWSNGTPYGQHGVGDDAPAADGQAVPDGTASAEYH